MFRTANWRFHFLTALCTFIPALLWSQQFSKLDRDLTKQMLRDAAADVKKYYYDAKFHGLDWDAEVRQAGERVDKADSMDAAVSEIAALLDKLNDSHTTFSLPPRDYVHDYGFTMQMIGEHCYVTHVRSGSDAENTRSEDGRRNPERQRTSGLAEDSLENRIYLLAIAPAGRTSSGSPRRKWQPAAAGCNGAN